MRQQCAVQYRDRDGTLVTNAEMSAVGSTSKRKLPSLDLILTSLARVRKGFYERERVLTMMNVGRSDFGSLVCGTRHGTCTDWIGSTLYGRWPASETV